MRAPSAARSWTLALIGAGCATAACAQSVSYSGSMGERALLVIDGTPRTLAVGAAQGGVRLVSVDANAAVVEVKGRKQTLSLGGSPVSLGGANSAGGGTQVVLTSGLGGHFVTGGSINGRAVEFVVDTGATTVSMGEADADRIGLKYKNNPRYMVGTANGNVPVYKVSLDVVRVGDVQVYNVEAAVLPQAMPFILLGNSFLTRFQMKRENDRLTLDKR